MIRPLLFLMLLLIPLLSIGQNRDLGGSWTGVLLQDAGGSRSEYPISLEVTQVGNSLKGYSYIGFYDRDDIRGKLVFEGKIKGDSLTFKELRLINEHVDDNMVWCLKYGTITITEINDMYVLQGKWKGSRSKGGDGHCGSGTRRSLKLNHRKTFENYWKERGSKRTFVKWKLRCMMLRASMEM
jgi:hypothetical protein